MQGSYAGRNALLKREVWGERSDWLGLTESGYLRQALQSWLTENDLGAHNTPSHIKWDSKISACRLTKRGQQRIGKISSPVLEPWTVDFL